MSSNELDFDVVMKLADSLEKQGFVVYTDSFYSSPVLYEELLKQGFGAVGTINPTRENCPKSLALQNITMLPKKSEKYCTIFGKTPKLFVWCLLCILVILKIR